MSEEPEPRVVASYCPEPACRRVGIANFVNSACKEVWPGAPWDQNQCPGTLQPAVSMAEWERLRDLLRRYREAHQSMALVAQEAGASEAYRAITKEVDDALSTE